MEVSDRLLGPALAENDHGVRALDGDGARLGGHGHGHEAHGDERLEEGLHGWRSPIGSSAQRWPRMAMVSEPLTVTVPAWAAMGTATRSTATSDLRKVFMDGGLRVERVKRAPSSGPGAGR